MNLARWFETRTRANGEAFVTIKDDAPEWLRGAVRDAHAGDLPSDWIYAECQAACEAIDEGTLSDEDDLHQHADDRVEIYTKALFAWAADMSGTTTWASAEEEAEEVGSNTGGCEERIRAIQFFAIKSIASSMLEAVAANTDKEERS
jgi:hypothetical protein